MPGTTAKPMKCPFCTETCSSREQIVAHLKREHKIVQNEEEVFQLMVVSSVSSDTIKLLERRDREMMDKLKQLRNVIATRNLTSGNGKEKSNIANFGYKNEHLSTSFQRTILLAQMQVMT